MKEQFSKYFKSISMFFKKKPFENIDIDYSLKDLQMTTFKDGVFKNCLFLKTELDNTRILGNVKFEDCTFAHLNLTNTSIGNHKGFYSNCVFEKCNFKGQLFDFTRFVNCTFKNCELLNINFSASSFHDCKFIGKLDDVTFNGIYDINKSPYQTLELVDFSEAIFGDFVNFYGCDLSSCKPPKGKTFDELLYFIFSDSNRILSTGSRDRIVINHNPVPI